jgi:CBS domain-containing protein
MPMPPAESWHLPSSNRCLHFLHCPRFFTVAGQPKEIFMKVTDRISAILNRKGSEIYSIPPDASVYSAVETMADKQVGALLVIDQGQLVGIVSERDYARKVILMGRSSKDTFVREIMTPSPITVCLDCCVDDAMRTMTTNRIRHLPVVDNGKVVGVLSIGDIVNFIILSQDQTIEHLEHYITGQYPC